MSFNGRECTGGGGGGEGVVERGVGRGRGTGEGKVATAASVLAFKGTFQRNLSRLSEGESVKSW